MQKSGKLFIISGPSGVGKSTVLKALFREHPDLYFSVSATTRAPREGEIDGVHYRFIKSEQFLQMVQENEFLEYAEYVGSFYGTPRGPGRGGDGAGARRLSRHRDTGARSRSMKSARMPCAFSSRRTPGQSWSAA